MEAWVEASQILTGKEKSPFPFALLILHKAGCGRRPGSQMNSLRSAWTAVLADSKDHPLSGRRETTKEIAPEMFNLPTTIRRFSLTS
jgi:hypothetical protein